MYNGALQLVIYALIVLTVGVAADAIKVGTLTECKWHFYCATQLPEVYFPRTFDIFGASHQVLPPRVQPYLGYESSMSI